MSNTTGTGVPDLEAALKSAGKALWWLILIRGILAVVFGFLAIAFPGMTLIVLTILFAAYSIVDGVTAIAHAVRVRKVRASWGWLLALGILSVVAGIVVALSPAIAGVVGGLFVVYLIAVWGIVTGIAGFPAAQAMTDGGRKVWAYIAAGLSLVFGIALLVIGFVSPREVVLSLIWVIGAYALVFGVVLVVAAIVDRATATKILSD